MFLLTPLLHSSSSDHWLVETQPSCHLDAQSSDATKKHYFKIRFQHLPLSLAFILWELCRKLEGRLEGPRNEKVHSASTIPSFSILPKSHGYKSGTDVKLWCLTLKIFVKKIPLLISGHASTLRFLKRRKTSISAHFSGRICMDLSPVFKSRGIFRHN